jgi:hypothetical protein
LSVVEQRSPRREVLLQLCFATHDDPFGILMDIVLFYDRL